MFLEQSYNWESILPQIVTETENLLFIKSGSKIGEKYRKGVEKIKRNLQTLWKYREVSLVFLEKKVSLSKLRVGCEGFRKTCGQLERKRGGKDKACKKEETVGEALRLREESGKCDKDEQEKIKMERIKSILLGKSKEY